MSDQTSPVEGKAARQRVGWLAALVVFSIYGGMAATVDFPRAAGGFKGDEATYYLMGHSLADDGDLAYRRTDLQRAFKEFPLGPTGVFLKKGQRVTGVHVSLKPPFVAVTGQADPDQSRLFYGKAFIYPAFAAPFVRLLGTNGFLVFNALLLTAAFLCTYTFLAARSGTAVSLLLASAFIFATVVPVYAVWITPELFNFALGVVAYFCWLYKEVAPAPPGWKWLRGGRSDALAAILIGVLTFSKITNVLLLLPFLAWLAWRRRFGQAALVGAVCALVATGLFAVNVAVMGDWNYQGGAIGTVSERATCYGPYPFQQDAMGFDVCSGRERSGLMPNELFDRQMFWVNLRSNLVYFFVGRNAGLVPYFFPGVFAIVGLLAAFRRGAVWQWFVLGGLAVQILVLIIAQPYTYFGSGGSVGDRYFMGVYGMCLFLMPPVEATWAAVVPWLVGGLFTSKILLNAYDASVRPYEHADAGPLRLFPVELTNINDLPVITDQAEMKFWYGDTGAGDPGFQIYYMDKNAYLRELDKSFWVRGESRAEVLVKTDRPFSQLRLTLTAGPVPTVATVRFHGQSQTVSLGIGQSSQITLPLGPGFPYKKERESPAYIWPLSVSSSAGFTPILFDRDSKDTRYLGVNVKPVIVP